MALKRIMPSNPIRKNEGERLKSDFALDGDLLNYHNKVSVLRANVRDSLELAGDPKTAGHFSFSKNIILFGRVPLEREDKEYR